MRILVICNQFTREHLSMACAWEALRCEHGPLSGARPRNFEEFQDRVADAFGGEVSLERKYGRNKIG
jgi:hypothetical protein